MRKARWQDGSGTIEQRRIAVDEQWKDGVIVRTRRDLDLPALLELTVDRNHGAKDLVLLRDHCLDVRGRETALPVNEPAHRCDLAGRECDLAIAEFLGEPGEVEPHLKVANIRRVDERSRLRRRKQLGVTRVRTDLIVEVRIEERPENLVALRR